MNPGDTARAHGDAESAQFRAGETVLVIGLGRSGRAVLDVLHVRGVKLYAVDESPAVLAKLKPELGDQGIATIAPSEVASIADELICAVLSPGIPLNSAVVQTLRAAGVSILSEIEVAYRISRAPIIAITGTKGKTTTTALLGALLRHAGHETYIGGNIGNALIGETAIAAPDAWVVAEVSSFQLETISTFRPRISMILNLSQDHFDRYASMDEYAAAKYRIFANQEFDDIFIGCLDDARLVEIGQAAEQRGLLAQQLWFSRDFDPRAALFVRDGKIVWVPQPGKSAIDVMPLDEIPLLGAHNVANVQAAVLAGLAAGCDPGRLREGVRNFRALAHRLELVAEIGGVRYIDDSKATNPGSVCAAIEAVGTPVVLIAGGKAKGTDFTEMGRAIARGARAAVLIGEAADEIGATITGIDVFRAASMDEAVARAKTIAQRGDTVLLSPGCASFDMFASAEARGDLFAAAVTQLTRTA